MQTKAALVAARAFKPDRCLHFSSATFNILISFSQNCFVKQQPAINDSFLRRQQNKCDICKKQWQSQSELQLQCAIETTTHPLNSHTLEKKRICRLVLFELNIVQLRKTALGNTGFKFLIGCWQKTCFSYLNGYWRNLP